MDVMTPSLLITEVALLIGALTLAYEWYRRRILTERSGAGLRAEVATVIAIFLLSFGLLWFSFSMSHGILSLALALGGTVSLFFPLGALGFFIELLLLRPWEVASHPIILGLPKTFAAFPVVIWGLYKIFQRDDRITINPALAAFTGFLVWLTIAGFFLGRGDQATSFLMERFFPVAVLYVLLLQLPNHKEDLPFLFRMTLVGILGILFAALAFTYSESFVLSSSTRLESFGLFGNSNDLASLFVVVFPFLALPILSGRLSLPRAFLLCIPTVLIVFGIWLTQSRGAFLSIFCMGLVWFAINNRSSKLTSLPILLIPVLLSIFVFRAAGDLEGSSSSRMDYIIAGLRMVKSSPLFGVGVGRYPELYELFTPHFNEWGQRTAHSSWILSLSEGGIPGFTLFFLLFCFVAREAYLIRDTRPEYLISLVGYGVSMSLLSHTYIFLPYLLFGLIGAASVLYRTRISVQEVGAQFQWRNRALTAYAMTGMIFLFVLPSSLLANEGTAHGIRAVSDLDKPDGAEHKHLRSNLSLAGSRGETLNFFLQLPAGKSCDSLRSKILNGQKGVGFRGAISWYFLPYIRTEHASYPGARVGRHLDPTVPVDVNKVCLAQDGPSWILGELPIPYDQAPGNYTGKVTFGSSSVALSLQVWKMQMPKSPSYPLYTEMTTWYNLLGHYGKWNDGEEVLAQKYLKALREHRLETISTHISRPKVLQETKPLQLNIYTFPTQTQSFDAINIKGRPDWAYLGFPTVPREEVGTPQSKEYLAALRGTLPEVKRDEQVMLYLWDEPQTHERAKFMQLLKDADAFAPEVKVMVTTPYETALDSFIDIFAPVAEEIGGRFPSVDRYQGLRKRGKEFWWYVSCMSHGCEALADTGSPDLVIERPSVYVRSIGWLGPLLGTDAFLYYHVNHGYQHYPERDPWESQWDFSGNGDGTLFYPGRPGLFGMDRHQPISSLRLKSLRQASYDAQYVEWMEKLPLQPEWWRTEKKNLLSGFQSWSKDFWKYNQLRKRVAEHLNKLHQ